MNVARQGRALGVALGIGALVGWLPAGVASAQACGYNYAGCTQPSVPGYGVGTGPTTTAPAAAAPSGEAPTQAASAAPTAATQSGPLPFTGTDAAATASAGVAAIGAGTVLVRRSRRRGRRAA